MYAPQNDFLFTYIFSSSPLNSLWLCPNYVFSFIINYQDNYVQGFPTTTTTKRGHFSGHHNPPKILMSMAINHLLKVKRL